MRPLIGPDIRWSVPKPLIGHPHPFPPAPLNNSFHPFSTIFNHFNRLQILFTVFNCFNHFQPFHTIFNCFKQFQPFFLPFSIFILSVTAERFSVYLIRDFFLQKIFKADNFYNKKCVIFDNNKFASKQNKWQNTLKYTQKH